MKTGLFEIELPSQYTTWKFQPIFDYHLGSKACDINAGKRVVKVIENDPYRYSMLGGDIYESIWYDDPRFESDLHIDPDDDDLMKHYTRASIKRGVDIFEPIKHKLFCSLRGNHEDKWLSKHHIDLIDDLSVALGVPYMGYSTLFKVLVKSGGKTAYSVDIFAHHGAGGGGKKGAKINRIMDAMLSFDANIYVMGHVHDDITAIQDRIGVTASGKMKSSEVGFIVAGSFYKTYMDGSTTYGEKGMMRPTRIKMPKLYITKDPVTGAVRIDNDVAD